ncbi:MAG: 50S ribosomal protein L4 [Candidatus Aminicenantes bacterium]|nr:50S ribosomal protein L4 [Candidatus Aminicenantes bacterium]
MLKMQVIDKSGNKVKDINANEDVFSFPVKDHLLWESVVNYRANQRRGTAHTKTRGEVSGGGRKPWRQKGTGRARAGSNRSPIWRKGGTTFGPRARDYSYKLPKQAKRNALKSALSMKYSNNQIMVLDKLEFSEPKTKMGAELMSSLKLGSALFIDLNDNKNLFLSMRNIPKVKAVDYRYLNIYDVLYYDILVFTSRAFESFMEKIK